mmetsp:Transcript_21051/g.54470  ORF Transcript_21051/g.54470 Transcript_21051/m.54470 type:complete len:243 (+) Transcript_21051:8901-9629(+)
MGAFGRGIQFLAPVQSPCDPISGFHPVLPFDGRKAPNRGVPVLPQASALPDGGMLRTPRPDKEDAPFPPPLPLFHEPIEPPFAVDLHRKNGSVGIRPVPSLRAPVGQMDSRPHSGGSLCLSAVCVCGTRMLHSGGRDLDLSYPPPSVHRSRSRAVSPGSRVCLSFASLHCHVHSSACSAIGGGRGGRSSCPLPSFLFHLSSRTTASTSISPVDVVSVSRVCGLFERKDIGSPGGAEMGTFFV